MTTKVILVLLVLGGIWIINTQQSVVQDFASNSGFVVNLDIDNMRDYSHSNYNFLKTYNFDRARAISIINKINPSYLNNIKEIRIIHSNKNIRGSNIQAMYYPYIKLIVVYEYGESDGWVMENILHELKHDYCYTNGQRWKTNSESHQGCFLNTPIDEKYGFIS